MKPISILVSLSLLCAFLWQGCSETPEIEDKELVEVTLDLSMKNHLELTRTLVYEDEISTMRILAFDVNTETLVREIYYPEGAGQPTTLRLPFGRYFLVFAGNFDDFVSQEGVTTMDDILVSLHPDPNPPVGAVDPHVAPENPYYYYRTGVVQFGIVKNIPVELRPITSQIILNAENKPSYYDAFELEYQNIGKSLSLKGESLAPAVRIYKGITGVGAQTHLSDTTFTFASLTGGAVLVIRAIDSGGGTSDELIYPVSVPIEPGNSYMVNFIFPSNPELGWNKGFQPQITFTKQ